MATTNFTDLSTLIEASWLNDVDAAVYETIPAHTTAIANHLADPADAHAASAITNTPAGSIAATTVQAAINELDTEKAALAGSASQVFSVAAATITAHTVRSDQLKSDIISITGTVASSALTAGLNPCILAFRSATLGDGVPNTRMVNTALSLVVPSGATLGSASTVKSYLALLALDNSGTIELAITNMAGGKNLDETTLISTTAISAASNSASVIYSTTTRTNVPFRVVGYIESTQATAGTWATAPSTLQGAGGNLKIGTLQSMIRLNTANGYGSTSTMIRRFSNVVTNQGSDISYADSATLGASFTINTSGVYAISHSFASSAACDVGISLNSTELTTSIASLTTADILAVQTAAADYSAHCATTVFLPAGSVIRPHGDATATTAGSRKALFTIVKVS